MKFQKQAFLHDPDNGVYGDCLRTVFACALDMDRDEVPHFNNPGNGQAYHENRNYQTEWLANRGLVEISIPYQGELDEILCSFGSNNTGVHYFLTGMSKTGVSHIVICRNEKIVWDTSLTDAGITGPCDNGYYFISLLAKRL